MPTLRCRKSPQGAPSPGKSAPLQDITTKLWVVTWYPGCYSVAHKPPKLYLACSKISWETQRSHCWWAETVSGPDGWGQCMAWLIAWTLHCAGPPRLLCETMYFLLVLGYPQGHLPEDSILSLIWLTYCTYHTVDVAWPCIYLLLNKGRVIFEMWPPEGYSFPELAQAHAHWVGDAI